MDQRLARAAAISAAALGIVLPTSNAYAADDSPYFVPEATTVTWNGSTAAVTFRVAAVTSESAWIEMRATATIDLVCWQNGTAAIKGHSEANTMDFDEYPANAEGVAEGTRRMPLTLREPTLVGVQCDFRELYKSVSVTLTDYESGVTFRQQGQVLTSRPKTGTATGTAAGSADSN